MRFFVKMTKKDFERHKICFLNILLFFCNLYFMKNKYNLKKNTIYYKMQSTEDTLPTVILNTNQSSSASQILTENRINNIITNLLFGFITIAFGALLITYMIF